MMTRWPSIGAQSGTLGREPVLPADADLVEGTITIRDRDGKLVGTYAIEAGDLAIALDAVMLSPVGEEAEQQGEQSEETEEE